MPELPDLVVYIDRLEPLVVGRILERVRLRSPFLLRSATPPLREAEGRTVRGLERIGKRIVFALEGELYLLLHLRIAGRLRWRERGAAIPAKVGLGGFDFPHGTLLLTEASPKKRASLHVVRGDASLRDFDAGGLEVLEADLEAFADALTRENHTLKRALTDPALFSGIGNAYSDEILHRARLSPVQQTRRLSREQIGRLYEATRSTLTDWIERLGRKAGPGLPEKVTAFQEGMTVHGRYGLPCPDCGAPVQRIVYAENETNYCARCQTGGRLLADRSLSRILKRDWPATLDELEDRRLTARP
jgi:formamidopyrimidine-DNA glycosylase